MANAFIDLGLFEYFGIFKLFLVKENYDKGAELAEFEELLV